MTLDLRVTIAIPVGPNRDHARYLVEAVTTAVNAGPAEVLLVDDMHGLRPFEDYGLPVRIVRNHWRLGIPGSFNVGVAAAVSPWVLMLGADDELQPDTLDVWRKTVLATVNGPPPHGTPELTFWALPVEYMDTGEVQTLPCNAAIVHKNLWTLTGGFPPESAVGACDAALLSIMIGNQPRAGYIREVPAGGRGLYRYRRHAGTDTASRGPWQVPILEARNLLTAQWRQPEWGRYS